MSHIALYRKFRPASFDEVKGQDHIVKTLANQIKTDRTAHAYLFSGTRGTGKTSIAKIFAKAVNCENPLGANPCNVCESCRSINEQNSLNVIEIDAASNNGVDNIRQIIDEVAYSPARGKYKVYIIDEVHMLSTGAFNALLKTLEEPPSYVIFILATTEAHKIPVTILSRCQRYDFKRLTNKDIVERLNELADKEGIEAEERAFSYIARCADGAMRDALSLLDRCLAFYIDEKLTYEKVLGVLGQVETDVFIKLYEAILDYKISECIKVVDEIVADGKDISRFVVNFTWFLRNVMIILTSLEHKELVDLPEEKIGQLEIISAGVELNRIIRYIRIFSELTNQMRYAVGKRTLLEIALVKICVPEMETDTDSLHDRIAALEKKLAEGTFAPALPEGEKAEGERTAKEAVKQADESGKGQPRPPRGDGIVITSPEGKGDVTQVSSRWKEIYNDLEPYLKTHLRNMEISFSDNDITITAADDWDRQMLKEKYLNEIKLMIKKVTGQDIDIRCGEIQSVSRASENTGGTVKVNFEIDKL